MGNFLNKLFGTMDDGYDDYDEYDAYETVDQRALEPVPQTAPREARPRRGGASRTVPFPGARAASDNTVVLVEAYDIDSAWPVCDHVKAGRTVICNTENLAPDMRIRFQDVISGSAYAIKGNLQAVSQFIFVFAPEATLIDFDDGRLSYSQLRDAGRNTSPTGFLSDREVSRYV
jgi:cell division inhibitor SepF